MANRRTYESALSHLSSIQSNRAITSLFSPPSTVSTSNGKSSSAAKDDLNALAIPEMLAWLGRAGISTSDLAKLKCIHVAGTKGKGSVCAYLTSILTRPGSRAGRVGTYTSPHLISVRERILLDGEPISQELFARYFFEVWDAFTASARAEYLVQKEKKKSSSSSNSSETDDVDAELQGPATKPFYFRFLTIMAFHAFLREGVTSAVIECGIGGEYDSTNVLPAEAVTASVVTQLGIDHVGMLGRTLPRIAWHKIGVAKTGRKCFTRKLDQDDETMQVMRQRTRERNAKLVEVTDQEVETWGGAATTQTPGAGGLEGNFQKYNQALAVGAAREHLRVIEERGIIGDDNSSKTDFLKDLPAGFVDGLQQAKLRGRCETVADDNVTWHIDGAHTAESLREVARWYVDKRKALGGDNDNIYYVLMFNQQERDAGKLLLDLYSDISNNIAAADSSRPFFDRVIFTRNELQAPNEDEPARDLSVQETASHTFATSCDARTKPVICDNIADAVKYAREQQQNLVDKQQRKIVVLVTGSLHLVGALLQTLEPNASL